ncbi:hypothetical protein KHA93_13335 [Bacillus sp. FJAT-49732]|uniref:Uncharacterized protein n=1 Tax=Lederbergia citrisecunda TaxID=2833583 RepID=A0A942YNT1_9BACI|nr:hypothetical protein [Lederbergia citrisecunda]MBS4200616.1 hypothetical protein [Lederbergia citrisecunda]
MNDKKQQVHLAAILELLHSKGYEEKITLRQLVTEAQELLNPLIMKKETPK